MTMKDKKFLEENFYKILDLRKACKELSSDFEIWVGNEAQKNFNRYSIFSSNIEIGLRQPQSISGTWFYSIAPVKDRKLKKYFSKLDVGVMLDSNFILNKYCGCYAYASVFLKRKEDLNDVKSFFINNLSETISKQYDSNDIIDVESNGVNLYIGDDFGQDQLKRSQSLEQLSSDLNLLARESVDLMSKYEKFRQN